ITQFYGQPELSSILLIMSFALLAEGFINPSLPLLIKSLRVEKQVSYAIGSQLAGFISTLILVYFLRTVSALALGYLATSLFRVMASYIVIPYRPKLAWDKAAGLELLHFGKFIILNTLIGWAVLNIDRLVIGKVLDMEQLAYYNIALYLGVYVSEVLIQVFAQSYFPAVSSIASDLRRVQEVYKKTVSTIIAIVAPFMMLLVLFSDELIQLLYDPRYVLAGGVLFWIGLKSFIHFIAHLQSGTLTALGKPGYVTLANGSGLTFLVLVLPEMTSRFGLTGSGIIMLASSVLIGFWQSFIMVRNLGFQPWVIVRPWLQLAGTGLLMTLLYYIITYLGLLWGSQLTLLLVPMVIFAVIIAFFGLKTGYGFNQENIVVVNSK
ncbi:MAG: oligosaccharide flippase family protein, partial [FCB group bacterium]|nr:oligosaccharide flippase family protein [FCB group bacterium]